MSRALLTWRTARVPHRCEFCRQPIEPGERYVCASLPLGTDIGNRGWWHSASHGEDGNACASYWLVDEPYERPLEMP